MPAELLIRPGHQDGRVIADLLAPGGAGRTLGARCPISRLVLDAAIAHAQPGLAENAHAAGVSVVVDPMTFLLQCQTDPDKPWSRLPYADAVRVIHRVVRKNSSPRTAVMVVSNVPSGRR